MVTVGMGAVGSRPGLNSWTPYGCTTMTEMFSHAKNFNANIGSWQVSKVGDMQKTFAYAEQFNRDINTWATDKVCRLSYCCP